MIQHNIIIDSPDNTIDNVLTYILSLNGIGYLSNDTDWAETVDAGQSIEFHHFKRENVVEFNYTEAMDLLNRVNPAIRASVKLMLKTTIIMTQEIRL
jgi:hypothetical protein